MLNAEPKFKRPEKQIGVTSLKSYNLTKVSDIIGIGAKNRICLINAAEGTDFSAGKKIKYEFWELRNPGGVITHVLALHNNIIISQTLNRAAEEIKERFQNISTLLILRPREKKKGVESMDTILEKKGTRELLISMSTHMMNIFGNIVSIQTSKILPLPTQLSFIRVKRLLIRKVKFTPQGLIRYRMNY